VLGLPKRALAHGEVAGRLADWLSRASRVYAFVLGHNKLVPEKLHPECC